MLEVSLILCCNSKLVKAGSNNRRKVETDSCSERTKRRRSAETLEVASNIHGGGERSLIGSTAGWLGTLNRRCSEDDLVGGIVKCKKETVFPKLYKKAVDEFEHTSENMLRSIAVYYSKGIMGKIMYMLVHYHLTLGSPGRILTDSRWLDRLKGSNHLKPNPSYQQGLSGAK